MIRTATSADRETVEQIVHEAYTKWVEVIGGKPRPMTADYAALIEAGRVWLLDSLDGLIVLVEEPDVLLIENVAVRPSSQGKGHGRSLLAFADERARARGFSAVRLYTHEKMAVNIALYESLGFRETSREEIDRGHLVHMRKDL